MLKPLRLWQFLYSNRKKICTCEKNTDLGDIQGDADLTLIATKTGASGKHIWAQCALILLKNLAGNKEVRCRWRFLNTQQCRQDIHFVQRKGIILYILTHLCFTYVLCTHEKIENQIDYSQAIEPITTTNREFQLNRVKSSDPLMISEEHSDS